MNPKLIIIDDKTYHSIDEMPPDIRQKYEQAMQSLGDANNNRIPDIFESTNIFADKDKNGVPDVLENITSSQTVVNSMKIVVNGKEFNGLEDLPPEARTKYQEAMGKLDANQNGVPDFAERISNTPNQAVNISSSFKTVEPSQYSTPIPVTPTITPDTSNGWALALAVIFTVLVCAAGAAGVWYFFLR